LNNFFKKKYFLIISFGALPAALLRWQIDQIFIVNTIGCFLLGLINSLPMSKRKKLFLEFGFCSSLTTFSGWSLKLYDFLVIGNYLVFIFYLLLTVLFGFLGVGLGCLLAKKIIN